jgi:predicted RNase H-like HicB family nuclease
MNSVQIVLETGPPNWSGFVPALPGCIATGPTMEETLVLLKEAIQIHLESMVEDGDQIPKQFLTEYNLDVQIAAD